MKWRIGSRGSRLALVQSNLIKARLEREYPEDEFEIVTIRTHGDVVVNRSIAAIGDNALFTREIENALCDGSVDIAVHSMKDLPAECAEGLVLAKAWRREDSCDVLVSRSGAKSLSELPFGATVATGSPRRSLLLRRLRPDLQIVDIRGNVDTRLRKLFSPQSDEPRLDGIVLAAAGLKRLGMESVISFCFSQDAMIPAPNQGQLAIELRKDDVFLLEKLNRLGDDDAEKVAVAERTFLRELGVDCRMPVGASAWLEANKVHLRCVFAKDEFSEPAYAEVCGDSAESVARLAALDIRRQVAGEVILVGAGPGDPELITVKGMNAVKSADSIVYDRLVSESLLKLAKPDCDLAYVGKAKGGHSVSQDGINALLAKKSLEFDKVVRLKGGDPFVFGRGGEEVEYLKERGIRCSIVPGVTSAIAAAASVGIPVTHRGVANSFEVVTAHTREGATVDCSGMLDEHRTYIFMMGLSRVREIAASMIAAGKSPDTPAAVIASATTESERCVCGTLLDIADKTEQAALSSPAVLVVGGVVALRSQLALPLSGKRLLLPTIVAGENHLLDLLRRLGANVDVVNVGRIVCIPNAVSDVDWTKVSWLAFTSRNGVSGLDEVTVKRILGLGIRVAAIGETTAQAIRAKGLKVDFVPSASNGETMVVELAQKLKQSDGLLHLSGSVDSLAKLAECCNYMPVMAYRNEEIVVDRAIDLSSYDGVFFTCASSVRRIMSVAHGHTQMVAIGPSTSQALTESGVMDAVVATSPSPEAMIAAYLPGVL